MVRQAVVEIERGTFHKVVPARQKLIPLPATFDAIRTFFRLCETYPQAFISIISIPGIGTWIGASPEMLISTFPSENGGKFFRTVALAGTQSIQPNSKLTDAAWRQKEIEEQALVSRYIINCFKKIRLREYEEIGPKTVAAGNLMHLKTTYTVDMDAVNFPDLGSVMLSLLHPTSAVCGMPKVPALDFLLKHEGFDRSFFSGFLGPVNIQDETHVYVNLRCMHLLKEQAVLYAGAGVTADSDPEREWHETEIKLNTLLDVIA
jgi:isochorismate synthase